VNQLSRAIIGVTVAPVLVATLVIGLLFAGVGAASPSQQECEASGGTFTKVQGQVQCVEEENLGNSENSQTTTNTTTGQGNIDNKEETDCSGPGGSGDTSSHCR